MTSVHEGAVSHSRNGRTRGENLSQPEPTDHKAEDFTLSLALSIFYLQHLYMRVSLLHSPTSAQLHVFSAITNSPSTHLSFHLLASLSFSTNFNSFPASSPAMAFTQWSDVEQGQCNATLWTQNDNKTTLPHHKDSMHLYAKVEDNDLNYDYYLRANDGKLEVLRVQLAPVKRTSNQQQDSTDLPKTWKRPKEVDPFLRFWRFLRNAPREIVTWTYNGSRNQKDGEELSMYLKYPIASIALTYTTRHCLESLRETCSSAVDTRLSDTGTTSTQSLR
ncbi:hypothetical protein BCR34DRAFT_223885 [Clohesyomyces aquaticus]|uniref:Uncharacterized protein n=1 Tax=Clohesyomyces aquaticus TaxID=1231657 RepID=A0A1Y1ZWL4_9PLEO|nr:hypothetical protein BCR34DRAFT_223885 [Clohesyomyces aquaticus]